jgi:hypothetical protein
MGGNAAAAAPEGRLLQARAEKPGQEERGRRRRAGLAEPIQPFKVRVK